MKTLRLLQYFPAPADASVLGNLNDLLRKIIRGDAAAGYRCVPVHCSPAVHPRHQAYLVSQLLARSQDARMMPHIRFVNLSPKPSLCGMPGYEPVKNLDKNNAQQAIVLEAVALALALDSDAEVGHQGSVLGQGMNPVITGLTTRHVLCRPAF